MSIRNTKRIPIGGSHHTELLQKSLSLKYPKHKNVFNYEQALDIQHNHTRCSKDYDKQLTYLEKIYDEERETQIAEQKLRDEIFKGSKVI